MPTYEYKCIKCDYKFEHFQRMTDPPLRECPVCKGEVKRLIGAGLSPILKGSGFYETDYKKKTPDSKISSEPKKEANQQKTPKGSAKKAGSGKD